MMAKFILAAVTLAMLVLSVAGSALDPTLRIDGKKAWYSSTPRRYRHAQVICKHHGMKIVEDTSPEIHKAVLDVVQKHGMSVWIGITDRETEGTWIVFSSGKKIVFPPNFWVKNEPNSYLGDEDCLMMKPKGSGLNDCDCYLTLPFFCI